MGGNQMTVPVIGGLKLEAFRVPGGDLYTDGVGSFTHTRDSVELDAEVMEYASHTYCDSCGLMQPSSDIYECVAREECATSSTLSERGNQ